MNERKTKLDRLEQALWKAPPAAPPSAPAQPIEVWQANVMRAVRLAVPEAESLLDLSWLKLQRAAVAAVVVAAVGWVAVLIWAPVYDSDLAQVAWTQSVSETWNLE
ncbi:MAG: hypothetical protein NTY53_03210 [Kiritimatiellaeota bacterium]|nr:hypothetical protein [Kiritimatiellota bacterium]